MALKGIGEVYVNKITLSDIHPQRFENSSYGLRDCILIVKDHAVYFGRQGSQTYPVTADGTISLQRIDLADLYVKNQVSGNNATVHILGTVHKEG
jgi:hypothetical protein